MINASDKLKAWNLFNAALAKDPDLKGSCCVICGTSGSLIAHHENYAEPLIVLWICRSDHTILHQYEDRKAAVLLNGEPVFRWE